MKNYVKQLGAKVMAAGAPTPEQMATINGYAMTPLTEDQVYVRKFLMSHSNIDRDNQCFPPDMIGMFAATMPGKSLLISHQRRDLPCGKFFDSAVEEMSAAQFQELTGEQPRLPDGLTGCKVQWAWAYLVKTPGNDELISQIDGGVVNFCSIGFAASDLVAVRDMANGPVKYWQYVSPGEALEGSLVWLGAQPGAAAYKTAHADENTKGEKQMKEFLKSLADALGLTLEEATALDTVKAAFAKITAEVTGLKEQITGLTMLAEVGKKYQADLVARYVGAKAKLGEVETTEDAQKGMKAVVETFPLNFIELEVKALEKRVCEKFPAEHQLPGTDGNQQRTKTSDNPLIPTKEG